MRRPCPLRPTRSCQAQLRRAERRRWRRRRRRCDAESPVTHRPLMERRRRREDATAFRPHCRYPVEPCVVATVGAMASVGGDFTDLNANAARRRRRAPAPPGQPLRPRTIRAHYPCLNGVHPGRSGLKNRRTLRPRPSPLSKCRVLWPLGDSSDRRQLPADARVAHSRDERHPAVDVGRVEALDERDGAVRLSTGTSTSQLIAATLTAAPTVFARS